MPSLTAHFDLLLHTIEPGRQRAKEAQEMAPAVREYLRDHQELTTVDPHTRLGGSYARRTATTPLKDVDILVFMHPDWKEQAIKTLLLALHDALQALPEELDDAGEVTLREQRRSINVRLERHDLSLDIVPVIARTKDVEGKLDVPDREWKRWVATQPLGYAAFLSELNAQHQDKVMPLIKLMKHWRDTTFVVRRPKSYWLESLVVQHLRRDWVKTEGQGFGAILADLFDVIADKFAPDLVKDGGVPSIRDAMLGNNVAWNWKREEFETFMRRLDEARRWSRKAVTTSDVEEAVTLWQRIFDADTFPATSDVEAGAWLGQLSKRGGLFVTPMGRVVTERSDAHRAIASPAKRFYGAS